MQLLVRKHDVLAVLHGLRGAQLLSGLAQRVVHKVPRLLIPLQRRVGVGHHVVALLQLPLGAVVLHLADLALGVDGDLRLGRVGQSGQDHALAVHDHRGVLAVHLHNAVFLVRGGHRLGGGADDGQAQAELALGVKVHPLLVVAGLQHGFLEVADGDGAARVQLFVHGDQMLAVFLQLDGLDLFHGLADAEGLKVGRLLVPLHGRVGELDHVVVVAQLHLRQELLLGVHLAVRHVHLVLGNVDLHGDDLALRVQDHSRGGGVHLRVAGLGALGVQAHAKTQLVLALRRFLNILGQRKGRKQSDHHAQAQKHCKDLFHFSFLLFQ